MRSSERHAGGSGSRGGTGAAQHRVSDAGGAASGVCGRRREGAARTDRADCAGRVRAADQIGAGGGEPAAIRGHAERWLLEAARVDRQFEPRWTLANFYFRQQKMDEFWKWMRAALEVSYGDRDAAFDLCWSAAPDAATILARAIPERHAVLAAFVGTWWEAAGRCGAGGSGLIASAGRERSSGPDAEAVLDAEMDRLLAAGRWAEAREIWVNLGIRGTAGDRAI